MQPSATIIEVSTHVYDHVVQCVRAQLEDAADAPPTPLSAWLQGWIERWNDVVSRVRTIHMLFYPLFTAIEPQRAWDVHALCGKSGRAVLRPALRQAQLRDALEALIRGVREHTIDASLLEQAMHTAAELAWDVRVFYESAVPLYQAMGAAFASDTHMDARAKHIERLLQAVRDERMWSSWVPGHERCSSEVVVTHAVQPYLAQWVQTVPWLCTHAPLTLTALYDLCKEAGTMDPLRQAVREHVQQQVAHEMQAEPSNGLLPRLMEAQTSWHALCTTYLRDSAELHHAVQDALESVVNGRNYRVVERLVAWLDRCLRTPSEDILSSLQPAIALFRCLYDKDVFQRLYQRRLAQRLLQEQAACPEAEEAMLRWLQQECGPDYTHRLDTMWHDVQASETSDAWARTAPADAPIPITVRLLTQAHWPEVPPTASMPVPDAVRQEAARFEAWYREQNSNRSLRWQHALDTAVLHADLGRAGIKELHVSAAQAAVLLQMQGAPRSYADLQEATGLAPDVLHSTLHSLTHGAPSLCVLQRFSTNDGLDLYAVNEALENDQPCLVLWQQDEEEYQGPEEAAHVALDRDVVLQAAVMRVLKVTSPLALPALAAAVQECVRSRFVPSADELQGALDRLCDKDAIERSHDLYHYVP
ncbi:hypothetical protein MNAN1_003334 [Malassezia nana]|uniref:Cullin family profile domain-containing protein n=1 Tax=Malassezia nana TaxID=180528 RepID=A0AAF0EPL3_9BASI|nr:hypothetical protein MNAN1_003334 [Malassezia nana]